MLTISIVVYVVYIICILICKAGNINIENTFVSLCIGFCLMLKIEALIPSMPTYLPTHTENIEYIERWAS